MLEILHNCKEDKHIDSTHQCKALSVQFNMFEMLIAAPTYSRVAQVKLQIRDKQDSHVKDIKQLQNTSSGVVVL